MDDFDPVAVVERCLRPVDAANDQAVELDGDAFLGYREIVDEAREINTSSDLLSFAIENYCHNRMIAICARRPVSRCTCELADLARCDEAA